MNTPEYRNAYMANLQLQINLQKMNERANQGNPSTQQYKNSGVSPFTPTNVQAKGTNVQAKGTKFKGYK